MGNRKKGLGALLRRGVLGLLSLTFGVTALGLAPLYSEALTYTMTLTERGRLPATPTEAEGSKVDFRDAFLFAGKFASDKIPQPGGGFDVFNANHAYLSAERSNVVVLYDGVNNDQKASAWYTQKLSLNQPFEFESYVFLSNATVQAGSLGVPDGMTFVMQNDPAGIDAIGTAGGGLGVFPRNTSTANMIYNSVAVEFDTFSNQGTEETRFDQQLIDRGYPVSWPHVAVASTATSTSYGFVKNTVTLAYNEFDHMVPTVPSSRAEGNTWFGSWKKINVKWQPLADGIHGNLSYTFDNYPEQTVQLDIDKYFNSTPTATWDRKVTWGFTGSNGLAGNTFGAMITKLPQEPEIDVTRKVRNVTKGETVYRAETIADVGDRLEYQVSVKNQVVEDLDIPLKKASISEDLQTNNYVSGSFNFTNSMSSGAVAQPIVTIDGDNNFTFEDTTYEYLPGSSFGYTYAVTVGNDTTEFINDVAMSSTYSTERNYGETTVNVLPKNLALKKTVDNAVSVNPIVGDELTVKVELTAENGVYLMNTLTDSVPSGFDIVPNSTYIYNKGATGPNELLADSSVWSGNSLTVERAPTSWNVSGSAKNNTMVVEYKIKPTSAVKGKEVTFSKAATDGTNEYITATDKQEFQTESNNVTVKVKTDVIVSFKNMDDTLLAASKIISSNTDFNGKNPVTLYYNTGDSFDLTAVINEISGHIFTNDQLTKVSVDGNIVETDLAEAGSVIDIFYSAKTTLTINFVNEVGAQLYTPIIQDHNIGDFVDLTVDQDILDAIEDIELRQYVMAERPSDEDNIEITVGGTEVTYKFKGTLILSSAPDKIDFGLHNTGSYGAFSAEKPTYDNPLVVSDSRATLTRWTLTATVTEVMTSAEDPSYTLPEALIYKSDSGEEILELNQARVITTHQHARNGSYNVSEEEWENKDNGFEMKLSSTQYRKMSDYKATILFTVSETP